MKIPPEPKTLAEIEAFEIWLSDVYTSNKKINKADAEKILARAAAASCWLRQWANELWLEGMSLHNERKSTKRA